MQTPTKDRFGTRIGIVVIGRDEGARLRRSLATIVGRGHPVVYVDSASSDGSPEWARSLGVEVVELDLNKPFTAGRARNAGLARLETLAPRTEFVQFVDGDCELAEGWLEAGVEVLQSSDDMAVACGRRRESFPERSTWNRLCDVEWDTPVGEASACGGDALMRVHAFDQVGGFDPTMIAGEEPDLCFRLGRLGWRVMRVDAEMTRHDAAMTRPQQWWQRAVRTGHTTAELLAKHGAAREHRRLRRALSAVGWSSVVPGLALAAIVASAQSGSWRLAFAMCVAVATAYAVLLARVYASARRHGRSRSDARAWALSCVCAKWPETWGMLLYAARRLARRAPTWIAYKDRSDAPFAESRDVVLDASLAESLAEPFDGPRRTRR